MSSVFRYSLSYVKTVHWANGDNSETILKYLLGRGGGNVAPCTGHHHTIGIEICKVLPHVETQCSDWIHTAGCVQLELSLV